MSDDAKRQQLEMIYENARQSFPEVAEITAEQLMEKRKSQDIVLVDVRQPQERAVSMIPGAITSETFEASPQDYEGKTIITYCPVGGRSGMYAQKLQARGFKALN